MKRLAVAVLLASLFAGLPAVAQTPATVRVQSSVNIPPVDCSLALTTGGTAQNIITASTTLRGFQIMNIDTTEPLWISFTGTAVAGAIGSYPLAAATDSTFAGGGSYSSQLGFGTNGSVSVVAATTGHKISCTKW